MRTFNNAWSSAEPAGILWSVCSWAFRLLSFTAAFCCDLAESPSGRRLEAEPAAGRLLSGDSNPSLSGEELVPQLDMARLSSDFLLGD